MTLAIISGVAAMVFALTAAAAASAEENGLATVSLLGCAACISLAIGFACGGVA